MQSEALWDFSENYAYAIQNTAQVFRYNKNQCTVMSVVYHHHHYYNGKKILLECFILMSDCLSHDTVAVYVDKVY